MSDTTGRPGFQQPESSGSEFNAPMVHQIDGDGNSTPHGIIHNVPYQRLQGGVCAVIIDPVVGDIGKALFASRDISSVKATRAPSPPQSRRRNDWADAVYLPGILNNAPEIYIKISRAGIVLFAPQVTTSGNLSVSSGATGSFTTPTGNIVTVRDGIITNIN